MKYLPEFISKAISDMDLDVKTVKKVNEGIASDCYIIDSYNLGKVFIKSGRSKESISTEVTSIKLASGNITPKILGYCTESEHYLALKYYKDHYNLNDKNFLENFIHSYGQTLNDIHNTNLNNMESIPSNYSFNENLSHINGIENKYTELSELVAMDLNEKDISNSFVHGDVNFGNLILDENGYITVYIDWEDAHKNSIYHDIAKAESMIDILSFYLDTNRCSMIETFRRSYGIKKRTSTDLLLWKFQRHYKNYRRFMKRGYIHYNFGVEDDYANILKKQEKLLEKYYKNVKSHYNL